MPHIHIPCVYCIYVTNKIFEDKENADSGKRALQKSTVVCEKPHVVRRT